MLFSILGHFMRICRYGSSQVDLRAEIHTRLACRQQNIAVVLFSVLRTTAKMLAEYGLRV